MITLFKLPEGDVALVVNKTLITTANPAFDRPAEVEAIAQNLAQALNCELVVAHIDSDPDGPDWEGIANSL